MTTTHPQPLLTLTLRACSSLLACLALASAARAEITEQQLQSSFHQAGHESFPYLSIQAGVAFPQQLTGTIDILGFQGAVNNTLDLDSGFNAGVALGYKFPDFRTEVAVGYSSFNSNLQVNAAGGLGPISTPGKDSVDLYSVLFNAYYDIPIWGAPEGNKLRFRLSSTRDTATPELDYANSIEIWDPNANNLNGGWMAYTPDSVYKVPRDRSPAARHNRADVLLLRVPLKRDNLSDNNETLTLTVTNGAGMQGVATAVIQDDGSGTLFSTQADDPATAARDEAVAGVLPANAELPLRAETISSSTPAMGHERRRPVIRVLPLSVSETSPYAVFTVIRQQIRSRWSPYIGAGVGVGNLYTPGCAITNCTFFDAGSAQSFTYQAMAGLSYRLSRGSSLFVEGGYTATSAETISTANFDPLSFWRINLGWRQRL